MLKRLFQLSAILLCAVSLAGAQSGPSRQERKLFDLVNKEREKAGVPKLEWDAHLAQAARAHSELMLENGDLSHQFSKEPSLLRRAAVTGSRFTSVGENVAMAGSVGDAHESLMRSEPHRENILNQDFNALGIAIVEDHGKLWVTQDFARNLSISTEEKFSDDVVAAVNRWRRAHGLQNIQAVPDARLKKEACSQNLDSGKLMEQLHGAEDVTIFTATDAHKLPDTMKDAALNKAYRRMTLGVCFPPSDGQGFSKYWIVAAFYAAKN
jgi:uncharacterized protein YkwD